MIVLALLLLLAAAALVVFIVVTGSTGEVPLQWTDLNLTFSPSPLVLFLLGALTLLLVVLALGLLRAGSRRSVEKRRELKRLRRIEDERQVERETAPAPAGTTVRTDKPMTTDHDHRVAPAPAAPAPTTSAPAAPTSPPASSDRPGPAHQAPPQDPAH